MTSSYVACAGFFFVLLELLVAHTTDVAWTGFLDSGFDFSNRRRTRIVGMANMWFHGIIHTLVDVRNEEIHPMLCAFASFFFILFSHYLMLPLRDEAGVSLGTQILPALFLCSLFVTVCASPIASHFLSRPGLTRERKMRQLYWTMSVILLCFFALYYVSTFESSSVVASRNGPNEIKQDEGIPLNVRNLKADNVHANLPDASIDTVKATSNDERDGTQHESREMHETDEKLDVVRYGDPGMTLFSRALRIALYLWVGTQNLIAMSALWARCAEVFSPDSSARLFGFIGGGATIGQLTGSYIARTLARYRQSQVGDVGASHAPPFQLIFLSSLSMLLVGVTTFRLRMRGNSHGSESDTMELPGQKEPPKNKSPVGPMKFVRTLIDGFALIFASPYLVHLCLYLLCTYCVASLFYFERSLIISSGVHDSNSRTAWFATINMYSGAIVATIQLLATGRLLKCFGLPISLSGTPTFATLGLLFVRFNPTPHTIAGAEVVRKVATYAVARPAREVLFTVVSKEEKYKAKLCIDTVVQRLGDTIGAGVFQVIDGFLELGASGIASMGSIFCVVWAVVAFTLGRRNQALVAVAS